MIKNSTFKTVHQYSETTSRMDDWVDGKQMKDLLRDIGDIKSRKLEKDADEDFFRFTFMLPKALHRRIKTACAADGISIKDKLTEILTQHFPEK